MCGADQYDFNVILSLTDRQFRFRGASDQDLYFFKALRWSVVLALAGVTLADSFLTAAPNDAEARCCNEGQRDQ